MREDLVERLSHRELSPAAREGARGAVGDDYDATATVTVRADRDLGGGGDGDDNADLLGTGGTGGEVQEGGRARAMTNEEMVETVCAVVWCDVV